MGPKEIASIITLLASARLKNGPIPQLGESERPTDVGQGYEIQKRLHKVLRKNGKGNLVGWKIGATTPAMQSYLGVAGPAYGRITSNCVAQSEAILDSTSLYSPGIECEVAMRIGRPSEKKFYDLTTISEIISEVFPAMEIVENRYLDFQDTGAPTLIADDFFHKACIVGSPVPNWQNIKLEKQKGEVIINGKKQADGIAASVMGHPFNALAWLANTLVSHGLNLKTDDIVLTGSVTPVIWLKNFPSKAEIVFDGLGRVAVDIL